MGDAGEALIDAESRIQERMEELAREREERSRPEMVNPETTRAVESLKLARIDLERQLSATSHDARRRMSRHEQPGGLDAVAPRHGDVGHDHIGIRDAGRSQQLVAVGDHGDHLELPLEHAAKLFGDAWVVLGEQDARSRHGPTVGGGRRAAPFARVRRGVRRTPEAGGGPGDSRHIMAAGQRPWRNSAGSQGPRARPLRPSQPGEGAERVGRPP